jgi:thymidylate synthase
LAWYLAASDDAEFISYYIPDYRKEAEIDGTVRGAYGPRMFSAAWHNQFENVVALLRRKSTSRQAVIQLFDHRDLAGTYKDIPCTCSLQFMIRDDRLNLTASMRSNDVFKGLPHDVFSFTMIQEVMARTLGLELGTYTHFASSLHLYDEQDDRAKCLLAEGIQGTVGAAMPPMPVSTESLWPSINAFLRAEAAIREGREVDAGGELLDPYWQDLVRLLRVFRHSKNDDCEAMALIRSQMSCRFYDDYIVAKESQR